MKVDKYQKFTNDVILVGIVALVMGLYKLLLLPILSKTLGIAQYGVWSQIIVTVTILSSLAPLGLDSALVRFLSVEDLKKKLSSRFFSIITISLFLSLILSIILFFSSGIISQTITKDITTTFLFKIASILVIVITLNQLTLSFFRARRQIKKYSAIVIVQTIAELSFILYLVYSGYGLFGALAASIVIKFISLIIQLVVIKFQIGFSLEPFRKLKPYFAYGLPLAPIILMTWIIHSSDLYILGFFTDTLKVGIYAGAYILAYVVYLFAGPLSSILYPVISRAWDKKNFKVVRTYLHYSFKYYLLLAIPATFALSILAKPLLAIFATPEAVSGAILVPFVVTGMLLYKSTAIVFFILSSEKRTKTVFAIYASGALINIILNFILIPKYGMLGAAIATLVTYVILFLAMMKASLSHFSFDLAKLDIAKSIAASIIMSFSIIFAAKYINASLILLIPLGLAVYSAIVLLTKAITKEEIKFFLKDFKRIKDGVYHLS